MQLRLSFSVRGWLDDICTVRGSARPGAMDEPQRLEVQHDAGRNTRLVLSGPVQLRPHVIDLDQANGNKGYHLHVEANGN